MHSSHKTTDKVQLALIRQPMLAAERKWGKGPRFETPSSFAAFCCPAPLQRANPHGEPTSTGVGIAVAGFPLGGGCRIVHGPSNIGKIGPRDQQPGKCRGWERNGEGFGRRFARFDESTAFCNALRARNAQAVLNRSERVSQNCSPQRVEKICECCFLTATRSVRPL